MLIIYLNISFNFHEIILYLVFFIGIFVFIWKWPVRLDFVLNI